MQVRSIYRGARISAFKCREVTREIQGLPVSAALELLTFTPKKAARLVLQTLKSAIANAENNNNLRPDKLVVQEAVVGEGPTLKRFTPRARGSASPIRKRTAHIRIIVTDDVEIAPKPAREAKSAAKGSASKSTKARKPKEKAKSQSKAESEESAQTPESNS
jgi:large subunit ribosomal protein L22